MTTTKTIDQPLWTVHDVSAYLGVPAPTLYQWRHKGDGPPAIRLGKHLRYVPEQVRSWVLDQAGAVSG